MKAFIKAKRIFTSLLISFTFLFNFYQPAYSESHLKITGVSGVKAPDVPLADTSMPDVVLDASLAGDVNVDVSTHGVPDGTTVKVKFKNEETNNPPTSEVISGMATIPVRLEAGNAKVIFAETGPYVPFITKSASNGKLDADSGTVGLYHLDSDVLDASGNGNHLIYYPGWEEINYTAGLNPNSKGIYFWSTANTYENRRVDKYGDPNGTGFKSPPQKFSVEFAVKYLKEIGSETSFPLIAFDQNISLYPFAGKAPWGWGEIGKYNIYHADAKGAWHLLQIPDPFQVNQWEYLAITHDGHELKVYVNGEEKGSVISDGNRGSHAGENFGLAAGSVFNAPGGFGNSILVVDEIRTSNIVRNREELTQNTEELLGPEFRARKILSSKKTDKVLKLVKKDKTKTKKGEPKREIRLQTAETLSPYEGEAKKDEDTVALFHFNGTTKDSVTKKALVGDPETVGFEEGKSGKDNSSISFEGQDDLLLVNKNLFPGKTKEWTIDCFSKPGEEKSFLPVGILTIDNGEIFAMFSYATKLDGETILSASSLTADEKLVTLSAPSEFLSDKWTHLALVYKDKKLQFLVNGKPMGEADLPSLYKKGDGAINVGSDGGDGIFNGQIDELRISDVARSQAELEVYAKR